MELVRAPTLAEEIQRRGGAETLWSERELVPLWIALSIGMEDVNAALCAPRPLARNVFLDGSTQQDRRSVQACGPEHWQGDIRGTGTHAYAAPSASLDVVRNWKADQYSLGVLFLNSRRSLPLPGGDSEVLSHHLYTIPPAVRPIPATTPAPRPLRPWSPGCSELRTIVTQLGCHASTPCSCRNPVSTATREALVIAKSVAEQMASLRAAAAKAQRLEDERQRLLHDRQQLLKYWAARLHRSAAGVVDQVNTHLNDNALQIGKLLPLPKGDYIQFRITFLDKHIEILLATLPNNAPEDPRLWGYGAMQTFGRSWTSNFLMRSDPAPYGTLWSIDLRLNARAAQSTQGLL